MFVHTRCWLSHLVFMIVEQIYSKNIIPVQINVSFMHTRSLRLLAKRPAKGKLPPPLTLFLIEAYDVTVIFVTSRGAKIQNFGAPEGDDLAAGVDGASQDGRVRI